MNEKLQLFTKSCWETKSKFHVESFEKFDINQVLYNLQDIW